MAHLLLEQEQHAKERDAATAEAAALREALALVDDLFSLGYDSANAFERGMIGTAREADQKAARIQEQIDAALATPGPGAALLERVKALEAETTAVRAALCRLNDMVEAEGRGECSGLDDDMWPPPWLAKHLIDPPKPSREGGES